MLFKQLLYRAFKQLIIFSLILLTLLLISARWLSNEIFSPPRKALQPNHMEYLQYPERYGLNIRQHDCLQGKAPCLLVEPDALAGAAKRGKILRTQLQAKGVLLPIYGTAKATLVLLHGRNGRKEDLLPVAERFAAIGFRSIIPDLPGHGDSPLGAMAFGGSTFEKSLPQKLINDVRQHFSLPEEPQMLWGMSMGGTFAISAASQQAATWDGVVIVNSFSQLTQVLTESLPKKWQPASQYIYPVLDAVLQFKKRPTISDIHPQQWASKIQSPALVVHGLRDTLVKPSQGKRLYQAIATENKRWVTVEDGGHKNVLSTPVPIYAEMSRWLLQVLKNTSGKNQLHAMKKLATNVIIITDSTYFDS